MVKYRTSDELLKSIESQDSIELGSKYLMRNYGPPKDVISYGEGSYLITSSGKRILDFVSGIAVCSLGHAPRVVSEAICDQSKKLIHTSNYFLNELAPKVAFLIDSLIMGSKSEFDDHGRVFFANSGAEANEAAFKLARRIKGPSAYKVVALNGAFHGRTLGALSATGQVAKQRPFEPLVPGFIHVEPGDLRAIEEAFAQGDVCAFIVEPILGEAGVYEISKDFMVGVRELCDSYKVLLIIDEVQCGFGRTGYWFGHQKSNIKPDMVTLAKSIASGLPVGALWARTHFADAFTPGDHGSTFGGGPLAMAGALATIKALIDQDACSMANGMGKVLRDGFALLDGVKSVRGEGLLLGIELDKPIAQKLGAMALDQGLFVNPIGDYTLRIAPALTLSLDEAEIGLSILSRCLSALNSNN